MDFRNCSDGVVCFSFNDKIMMFIFNVLITLSIKICRIICHIHLSAYHFYHLFCFVSLEIHMTLYKSINPLKVFYFIILINYASDNNIITNINLLTLQLIFVIILSDA